MADFPHAKRRRMSEESDSEDDDAHLGTDATREQVVHSFITKIIAIRSEEDEKLLL